LPVKRRPPDTVFDVVIAGSGPAGSLLAARLSAQGKSVLIVEAGPYVPERTIYADELKAIAQTYAGAGLQRANEQIFASDPGMFILQGRCVGGGGLVNNAVCFMLAKDRQVEWRNAGFPVSETRMLAAFRETGREIGIGPISEKAARLNPAVQLLEPVFGTPEKPDPNEYAKPGLSESLVNLSKCWSYGLCNVGCGRGAKRNALQVHLKDAIKTGNCTLVPDAEATDLSLNGRKVMGMHVRLRDGQEVTVRGKEYVLSCGPIGSSAVLLRTTGIRKLKLPIGNRFCVNVGAPMFAFTRNVMHAQPSVQIAHHYIPPDGQNGFVIESWYNPPGANAMAMPGFFDEHHFRMLQYARTVAAAPLVGSTANGKIRIDGQGAPEISLPIRRPEFARLRRGLIMLAQSFLEGGAQYALAGFANGRELHTQADIDEFDRELARLETSATHRHLLSIGTGHPQGGNAMSDDPAVGVVDKNFRVRGLDNLRVCDGSIFPAASGVNPQWTIFALAHLCGEAMA
jgi:choline dehydrogenase-like flavoprotein